MYIDTLIMGEWEQANLVIFSHFNVTLYRAENQKSFS